MARKLGRPEHGPALQTIAVLAAYPQLDTATQAIAEGVIAANVAFVLGFHQNANFNLWEETFGQSFLPVLYNCRL